MTYKEWTTNMGAFIAFARDPNKHIKELMFSMNDKQREEERFLFYKKWVLYEELQQAVDLGMDPMWLDYVKQHLGVKDDER